MNAYTNFLQSVINFFFPKKEIKVNTNNSLRDWYYKNRPSQWKNTSFDEAHGAFLKYKQKANNGK